MEDPQADLLLVRALNLEHKAVSKNNNYITGATVRIFRWQW
jgi:hypothetical protein